MSRRRGVGTFRSRLGSSSSPSLLLRTTSRRLGALAHRRSLVVPSGRLPKVVSDARSSCEAAATSIASCETGSPAVAATSASADTLTVL